MKLISIILFIMGIGFGLLGLRSCWRNYTYAKTSVVSKASVISAEVTPNPWKNVGGIQMTLRYMRDGLPDTIDHHFTKVHTRTSPLPKVDELKANTYYVRYLPSNKQSKDTPNWLTVSDKSEYVGNYGSTWFVLALTFILMGRIVSLFKPKKSI